MEWYYALSYFWIAFLKKQFLVISEFQYRNLGSLVLVQLCTYCVTKEVLDVRFQVSTSPLSFKQKVASCSLATSGFMTTMKCNTFSTCDRGHRSKEIHLYDSS